jgi:hypothetical protein
MPDLVTHTAAAYFLVRSPRFQRFRVLFYLGTILPDLLARPLHILWPQLLFYTLAVHTPIFMLIFCLMLSEFFAQPLRRTVFAYLYAGVVLHFLLDALQRHLGDGYYWLFPFSWKSFEIGLFWPETSVTYIPLWLLLIVTVEGVLWARRKIHRL